MHIVFVGCSGVPRMGTAADTRLAFFANMLSRNNSVTIVNRYSSIKQLNKGNIDLENNIKVVDVIKSRESNVFFTRLLLLLSFIIEPIYLLNINKKTQIDILHVYSGHFLDIISYWLLSRLIGAKVVYQYVEYRSKVERAGFYHKLNGYLCDFHGAKFWDGAIPISNFLQKKAAEINKGLKQLKVNPLCDFSLFDNNKSVPNSRQPYLLFCGSVGYKQPIQLIINSYDNSLIKNSHKLVLILSGSSAEIQQIRKRHPEYIIKCKIPYSDLIAYYKNASVLLIPLRDTIQDIARFPNKICEYVAAHGAILTTNFGEIPYYFKDGDNAIVAEDFSINCFTEKMDEIEKGYYDLDKIRDNAYILGKAFFSIESFQTKLSEFLENVRAGN